MTIEQLLCEIEASTNKLKIFHSEKRFDVMPYELGRIGAFSLLIQDMVVSKISESNQSSNGS